MTCRKAKKWLPLRAGGELTGKKARKVEAHVGRCPGCGKEAEEMATALIAAKGLARSEPLRDWTDAEWRRMLNTIKAGKVEKGAWPRRLVETPAFAFGIALLVFAAAMLLLGRRWPGLSGERPTAFVGSGTSSREKSAGQDVLSMTIVSQETGLKIVWFFNRNFEWKETPR